MISVNLTVDNMVNAGACSNSIKGVFIDGNSITAGRQIQAVNNNRINW